jgi:hypothetical protein
VITVPSASLPSRSDRGRTMPLPDVERPIHITDEERD